MVSGSRRGAGVERAWSDWKFDESFGYPTFLNYGKNHHGARDRFV
jgi:hypothetical protein